jgi:hypothetical protein
LLQPKPVLRRERSSNQSRLSISTISDLVWPSPFLCTIFNSHNLLEVLDAAAAAGRSRRTSYATITVIVIIIIININA